MALPTFLTVAEVAKAARCTVPIVRNAIRDGRIPAVRPHPHAPWLVQEEHALAWICGNTAPADDTPLGTDTEKELVPTG